MYVCECGLLASRFPQLRPKLNIINTSNIPLLQIPFKSHFSQSQRRTEHSTGKTGVSICLCFFVVCLHVEYRAIVL